MDKDDNMKSICFVGFDNYPVLNPAVGDAYIGGESVQQTLLARAFVETGWSVHMIVKDYGQPDREVIDRITLWKSFRDGVGVPGVRYFHPRISSLWRAMGRANTDVYYHSCAGMMTGLVAMYCKLNKRRFVFRIAHDTDCIPGKQMIRRWYDRKIYEYGLRRAHIIAAQGLTQVKLLKEHYGLGSAPINMVVELPAEDFLTVNKDIDVLWVNNMRHFKHPERFVELAAALPEYRFVMIGGPAPGLESYFEAIRQKALPVRNLEFLGAVPYSQVNCYYSRAKIFVNTSETEGFPNSFLQAWIRKLPVVSFFDPDNLIATKKLGVTPKNLEEMIHLARSILVNEDHRRDISETARAFALANYSPRQVVRQYAHLLSECG